MYRSFGRSPREDKKEGKKRGNKIGSADILAVVLALLCAFSLVLTSASQNEKYISAAITFDSPEEPREKGFWDIFAEGAARFFASFAPDSFFEDTSVQHEGVAA